MKPPFRVRACALLAIAFALSGCGKNPSAPGGTSSEESQVTTTLNGNPLMVGDDVFGVPTSTQAFGLRRSGANAVINPRWFWRTITSATPTFTCAFSDTDSTGRPQQVDVTISRHLVGQFNILKAMPGDSTSLDSANLIHKPLDDTWVRNVRLRRFHLTDQGEGIWRVVAASAVKATSSGATTNIFSVRVQSGGRDTTFTDPLQLFTLDHVFHFTAGDSVVLTATTGRNDDVVLAYWHDHREPFRNNGDNTYSFTLHLGNDSGYRWFGVNALSHATLFDDVAPYDSQAWLGHCFVGEPPQDYYP